MSLDGCGSANLLKRGLHVGESSFTVCQLLLSLSKLLLFGLQDRRGNQMSHL